MSFVNNKFVKVDQKSLSTNNSDFLLSIFIFITFYTFILVSILFSFNDQFFEK